MSSRARRWFICVFSCIIFLHLGFRFQVCLWLVFPSIGFPRVLSLGVIKLTRIRSCLYIRSFIKSHTVCPVTTCPFTHLLGFFFLAKKIRLLWLCVDFGGLNDIIIKEKYQTTLINSAFSLFRGPWFLPNWLCGMPITVCRCGRDMCGKRVPLGN